MEKQILLLFKKTWPDLSSYLGVPNSPQQYETMRNLLDLLIDDVGCDENHPLASLLDLIGDRIYQYESEAFPEVNRMGEKSTPASMLKFLMDQHNLKQVDLVDIFGSQGVVSEILNEKREMNLRQVKELSKKFRVSVENFI